MGFYGSNFEKNNSVGVFNVVPHGEVDLDTAGSIVEVCEMINHPTYN